MTEINVAQTSEEIKAAALLRKQRVKDAQQQRMAIAQSTTVDRVQMPEEYYKAQSAQKIQQHDLQKLGFSAVGTSRMQNAINAFFMLLTLLITSSVQVHHCPAANFLLIWADQFKATRFLFQRLNNAKLLLVSELAALLAQIFMVRSKHGLAFWKRVATSMIVRVAVHLAATLLIAVFCEPDAK